MLSEFWFLVSCLQLFFLPLQCIRLLSNVSYGIENICFKKFSLISDNFLCETFILFISILAYSQYIQAKPFFV